MAMQFATWNVNSLTVRLPQVLDWLAANPVDALVLQETKTTDDKFPREAIEAAGYQVAFFGQKTYNGVALLSRHPASDVEVAHQHQLGVSCQLFTQPVLQGFEPAHFVDKLVAVWRLAIGEVRANHAHAIDRACNHARHLVFKPGNVFHHIAGLVA